jgi:hypothetical protein
MLYSSLQKIEIKLIDKVWQFRIFSRLDLAKIFD